MALLALLRQCASYLLDAAGAAPPRVTGMQVHPSMLRVKADVARASHNQQLA